jgi:hypothetical protein
VFILTDITDARMMDAIRANPYAGIRSASSAVAADVVEAMISRCYGEPIPMALGRCFAEDN